jgi:predicted DNA-binding protein YlxM (UPF0122 family)
MTMLYDFYGDLLTDRQREFYDLYYNEDFSLAEIAENAGITRQGVRDVLVRSEATLREMEEKTGIVQRFLTLRRGLEAIEKCAAEITQLNYRSIHSDRLAELVEEIENKTAQLKE